MRSAVDSRLLSSLSRGDDRTLGGGRFNRTASTTAGFFKAAADLSATTAFHASSAAGCVFSLRAMAAGRGAARRLYVVAFLLAAMGQS